MNTLELDIVSPTIYANPTLLHERYERYRKDAPVAWIEQEPYRPFWALTRHADIVEIEKQNTLFRVMLLLLRLLREINSPLLLQNPSQWELKLNYLQ